ncbi:MAG TPA: hypothetical protein VH661_08360 [Candidatus Dormibacteraeota bacterium]|nr:hypothetical protein [Candidatus Dormibacteraeota bacterium]
MTTGWIIINIALALAASAILAGITVLVPHRLHRHAMSHDRDDALYHARYHGATVAPAGRPAPQRRETSPQRRPQTA